MIQSKKRWFLLSIRLIGSILLIFYSYNELSTISEYYDWTNEQILISGFIGFMGILNLVLLLTSYEIEITEAEIVKKSVFGFYKKEISRKRIVRFAEFDFSNESLIAKSLLLFGDKVKIEISSVEILNYEVIKAELINGLDEDKTYKSNCERYLDSIGLMLVALILIIVFVAKNLGS